MDDLGFEVHSVIKDMQLSMGISGNLIIQNHNEKMHSQFHTPNNTHFKKINSINYVYSWLKQEHNCI